MERTNIAKKHMYVNGYIQTPLLLTILPASCILALLTFQTEYPSTLLKEKFPPPQAGSPFEAI